MGLPEVRASTLEAETDRNNDNNNNNNHAFISLKHFSGWMSTAKGGGPDEARVRFIAEGRMDMSNLYMRTT